MGLETASYIAGLNSTNPLSSDPSGQGDDHIRLIKAVLKATFPNLDAAVDRTPAQMNYPVPIGMIMAWPSDTIPSGWALCNGQTVARSDGAGDIVTPDLRGKSIIGTPVGGTTGTAGGSDTQTTAAGGAHNHGGATGNGGSHTHTVGSGGSHTHTGTTNSDGSHSHSVSSAPSHDHFGFTAYKTLTVDEIPSHDHFVVSDETIDASAFIEPTTSRAIARRGQWSFDEYNYYLARGTLTRGNVGLSSLSGGGAAHRHNISADGAHTHSLSTAPAHDHSFTTGSGGSHSHSLSTSSEHTHSISTQAAHTHTVDTRSAFVHLNWVMKV